MFAFAQMLPLATMAASVHDGFGRTADAHAWSYIAARSVIPYLWWPWCGALPACPS